MFEANQSIMLMGTAASTDVSLHLSNAATKADSESRKEVVERSVIRIFKKFFLFIILGLFRNWIN